MTQPKQSAVAVRVSGIRKRYPGTVALDGVDMEVAAGEIHALVGGNGSGKSTLIKILCGVISAEPGGSIEVNQSAVATDDWSHDKATAAEVHAVHQDLGVFLDLTVSENLAMGSSFTRNRLGTIAWPTMNAKAQAAIDRFQIAAAPQSRLRSLTQANRTLVAIARVLQDGTHVRGLLILDEPTAALPTHESDMMLDTLQRYAEEGQSILYVSHRLDEILRIADKVTVLRDGRSVGTHRVDSLDEAKLARLIVGAELAQTLARPTVTDLNQIPALKIADGGVGPLRGVNLNVMPGEIVGIAGLVGSGRSTLLRAIFGAHSLTQGRMMLDGQTFQPRNCRESIRRGVAYVPENRADDAAFADLSIIANIVMPRLRKYASMSGMRDRAAAHEAETLMKSLLVRAGSSKDALSTLSGGNQQKVILARWLGALPRVLLLDEPTQGVDVGARAEIHGLIRHAADEGLAVLVVASDPEEMALLADRVAVIRDGRLAAHLAGEELTPARLTTEIHRGKMEVA